MVRIHLKLEAHSTNKSSKFNSQSPKKIAKISPIEHKKKSSNFVLDQEGLYDDLSDLNFGNTSMGGDNSSHEILLLSREKSLAIKLEKKEALKNMSTLRKVHSNKVRLEQKRIKDILKSNLSNKISNLKFMCFEELRSFADQYIILKEIVINLIKNESKLIKTLINQENTIVQRNLVEDLMK